MRIILILTFFLGSVAYGSQWSFGSWVKSLLPKRVAPKANIYRGKIYKPCGHLNHEQSEQRLMYKEISPEDGKSCQSKLITVRCYDGFALHGDDAYEYPFNECFAESQKDDKQNEIQEEPCPDPQKTMDRYIFQY